MKFTLSWLEEHLATDASVAQVVEAMTMAGLEVEHVEDPAGKLAAFSVARIVEAVQHPNADRLRVCQVDTKDGRKEIVCGAPNARAGLATIYAPIGTFVPGSGITLEPRAVRGVVSNGMLCSAAELETAEESDGILELSDDLAIGTPAAEALGLEAVIDFEVTPNRPDWLGVQGIAGESPALVVGSGVNTPLAPVTRARIARELLAMVRGTTVTRSRDDITIAAIVVAACRQAEVPIEHPPYAMLVEIERLLGKALARKTRKAMGDLCRTIARSGADARAWSKRALASHDRVAVVASGDASIVLADVLGVSVDKLGPAVKGNARAEELLRFVLSPLYLDLRRSLGLEGGA